MFLPQFYPLAGLLVQTPGRRASPEVRREVAIFARRNRLFRLFGIDVAIDPSWMICALLIGWTLAAEVFPGVVQGLPAPLYWWMAAIGTLGLFGSILLHEASHALTARRFGLDVRRITLFIFGGVAEMGSEPRTPKSELLIALAGPAASLLLAGLAFAGEAAAVLADAPVAIPGTLWYLGFANAALALFNMVPAFPLDGGRVLRAALWAWRGDLTWATIIASRAGTMFGLLLMAVGGLEALSGDLIGGVWRFLIGLFLRGAAIASRDDLLVRNALAGTPVAAVMNPFPVAVAPELGVDGLVEGFIYRHRHASFPVVEDGLLVGTAGVAQVAALDRTLWPVTRVGDIMVRAGADQVVAPESEALAALKRLRRNRRGKLWVASHGALVGVLSWHDLREYLTARLTLDHGAGGRRPPRIRFSALP